jgi:hypothetical protein
LAGKVLLAATSPPSVSSCATTSIVSSTTTLGLVLLMVYRSLVIVVLSGHGILLLCWLKLLVGCLGWPLLWWGPQLGSVGELLLDLHVEVGLLLEGLL